MNTRYPYARPALPYRTSWSFYANSPTPTYTSNIGVLSFPVAPGPPSTEIEFK